MSDPDIHLKLDRILAGQERLLARIEEQDGTIAVLVEVLTGLNGAIATNTETIGRLSKAMSEEEGDGDLAKEFASIADTLKAIQQDGARMVVLVGRLPDAVAQVVQDAITLAQGGGVDIPPEPPG